MTKRKKQAFTLIEILVVLGIIMILAAILFPAFNRAREQGYQAHCASNLKQIHFAVSQYHTDHKLYPGSLAFVVSESMTLPGYGTSTAASNKNSKGYFKGGLDSLICPDDDTEDAPIRSSYGDISTGALNGSTFEGPDQMEDPGRYVWNYLGYSDAGWAVLTGADADALPSSARVNPGAGYDRRTNPIQYSLSNRYAPPSTIITHCVFHRMPTAKDLASPTDLYDEDAGDSRNARDIVLRLDGSARAVDISEWKDQNKWIIQTR